MKICQWGNAGGRNGRSGRAGSGRAGSGRDGNGNVQPTPFPTRPGKKYAVRAHPSLRQRKQRQIRKEQETIQKRNTQEHAHHRKGKKVTTKQTIQTRTIIRQINETKQQEQRNNTKTRKLNTTNQNTREQTTTRTTTNTNQERAQTHATKHKRTITCFLRQDKDHSTNAEGRIAKKKASNKKQNNNKQLNQRQQRGTRRGVPRCIFPAKPEYWLRPLPRPEMCNPGRPNIGCSPLPQPEMCSPGSPNIGCAPPSPARNVQSGVPEYWLRPPPPLPSPNCAIRGARILVAPPLPGRPEMCSLNSSQTSVSQSVSRSGDGDRIKPGFARNKHKNNLFSNMCCSRRGPPELNFCDDVLCNM